MINKETNKGLIFNERYNKMFADMLKCSDGLKRKLKNFFKPFVDSFNEQTLNLIELNCNTKTDCNVFAENVYGERLDVYLDFNGEGKDSLYVEFRKNCQMLPDELLTFLVVPLENAEELPTFNEKTALIDLENRIFYGEQGSVCFGKYEMYNNEECPVAIIGYYFDAVNVAKTVKLGCRVYNEGEASALETTLSDIELEDFLVEDENANKV